MEGSPSTLPPNDSPPPAIDNEADGEDHNPVVGEFDLYIVEPEHPLYVIQYVDRPGPKAFTSRDISSPLEMRIKPKSGFFEADIRLDLFDNYDRGKGIRFGEAMKKVKALGQKGYGPAVGFERAMPRPKRRGAADEDEEMENADPADASKDIEDDFDKYMHEFEDANEKGHVLNTITHGGQMEAYENGHPTHLAGIFKGNQIHLTKVTGFVKLSADFHHLDAAVHLDIVANRKKPSGAAQEPKSILNPTTAEATQEAAKFYKEAAQEPWEKLRYANQDTGESWTCFNERMYFHDVDNSIQLVSNMTNEEYVESISAKKGGRKSTMLEKPEILEISDNEG